MVYGTLELYPSPAFSFSKFPNGTTSYTCKRTPKVRKPRSCRKTPLPKLSVSLETRMVNNTPCHCILHHMLYPFTQNSSIHSETFFGCLQGSQTLCVYCDNTMRVVSLCNNDFLFQHCNWSEANTHLLGKCMNYKIYFKDLHCCYGC